MKNRKSFLLFLSVIICAIGISVLVFFNIFNRNIIDNVTSPATITIGATAVPHAEILAQVVPILHEAGYEFRIIEFDDYILPNIALNDGEIDVNFFQHVPYMENFNSNHNTDLVSVFGVHFEPLQLYAGRLNEIQNIPQNSTITIPDDPTNEARALQLLEYLGLITLEPNLGLSATVLNIAANPLELNITPLSAELLTRTLPDVDFAVINGNYALQGGVSERAIEGAAEAPDSEAAIRFTNVLAVKAGNENLSGLQALIDAISSEIIREFIENQYQGRVVPRF